MPFWNERWKPLISDIIAITVATPMTMPSRASIERMRFAASACRAMRTVSRNSVHAVMAPSVAEAGRPAEAAAVSLLAQRIHRVEPRRAHRRVEPEEYADQRGHEQAE